MWRPEKEEWEKERDQWLNTVGGKFADSGEIMEASVLYEAGADAMLNSLTSQGRYINNNTYIDYPQLIASIGAQNKRGHIVFIEES